MIEQRYGTIPVAAPQGKLSHGLREFYFYCIVSPGKYEDKRIVCADGEGYNSIAEAFASLPLSVAKDHEEMRRMIAKDFGLGLGKIYDEFNVVAYTGSYHTTKPLAWYLHNDETKYIKHPQIGLMVQRYEEMK